MANIFIIGVRYIDQSIMYFIMDAYKLMRKWYGPLKYADIADMTDAVNKWLINDWMLILSTLCRFLRAKKFNHDKAFATLVNYHRKRSDIREVYDKVSMTW